MPSRDVAKTSGTIAVLVTSTVVSVANANRVDIIIENDGANIVYLQLQTVPGTPPTAVAGQGLRLAAAGTSASIARLTDFGGAIAAIALVGTTNITVAEL